jgi:alpha-beta hydrolase superfamily lysophospholipase
MKRWGMPPFTRRMFLGGMVSTACLTAAGCHQGSGLVVNPGAAGGKGETFGYRKWLTETVEPDVVVIGIHGFCGAAVDYTNLGNHLLRHQPQTALYAYELRGQGSDPIHARRGDIGNPLDWSHDLFAFTEVVRDLHPGAKIVWFGESMGSLIAAHAYRESSLAKPPCDGLVLSSPIVRFRDDIPAWTPGLVQVAATTLPLARISLETLSGGQSVQMTEHSQHNEQVKKNAYHVEQHTLRLIGTLTWLIDNMNRCAGYIRVPLLILHAEHDYFNDDADVRGFVARVPEPTPVSYRNYPGTYHLLMYDTKREMVFRDVRKWLGRLRMHPSPRS